MPELVNQSQIAEMIGVTPGRVSQMAREGKLPKPYGQTSAGRVWRRATIKRWAERRGTI